MIDVYIPNSLFSTKLELYFQQSAWFQDRDNMNFVQKLLLLVIVISIDESDTVSQRQFCIKIPLLII